MHKIVLIAIILAVALSGCNSKDSKTKVIHKSENRTLIQGDTLTKHLKSFDENLPTIGLLIYNGVLTTEVTAAADVFSKPTEKDGKQLFNVITIAETIVPIVSEEGLTLMPDYTFENTPELTVLFVPSAYDMYAQVHNKNIISFIQKKNKETTYTVSNCAGANLIGVSGIADGKKIVTWIGGGKQLQKDYPNLLVQDDSKITYVEDGKYISSNGNLASYISALKVVEKLSSKEHREFVASYLYLDRLQSWKE